MGARMTLDQLPAKYQAQIFAQLEGEKGHPGTQPQSLGKPKVIGVVAENGEKRIRQSAGPLENKLEADFHNYLKSRYPEARIYAQAKRYRLGNGIWYKPDLVFMLEGRETIYEVKGPKSFRGGFENLKVAASTYPEADWWLAWRVDGTWKVQNVLT